ncbi:restriction endonuclease [Comamonas flocculans]|uniref:Restriction endonuclease n=1 Tax=Comamonas flocculans TaxID=2597701 RepID=A0A5B8RSX9_9BURK|nr:restriction endonuclease [Comamonas flocculans]QEA12759.1 hypothetical protein FOZ74_06820 [Comamonas flocculans]
MAKRRKRSTAKDLFDLVAVLPWWVGVILAILAYVLLHRFAVGQVAVGVSMNQIGNTAAAHLLGALAFWGQYLVPLIFLAAALASALKRRRRQGLVASAAADSGGANLRALAWRDFELLVGEAFRMRGYTVIETGGGGADGGVDLRLVKGRETFLVQCKHWKAFKVPVQVARELFGVMAAEGAAGGFVVTSGAFTSEALAFVKGCNIELIDGPKLKAMIDAALPTLGDRTQDQPAATSAATPSVPPCPRCSSPMVKRVSRRGEHAGEMFWGCSTYPKCRGTRALSEP